MLAVQKLWEHIPMKIKSSLKVGKSVFSPIPLTEGLICDLRGM